MILTEFGILLFRLWENHCIKSNAREISLINRSFSGSLWVTVILSKRQLWKSDSSWKQFWLKFVISHFQDREVYWVTSHFRQNFFSGLFWVTMGPSQSNYIYLKMTQTALIEFCNLKSSQIYKLTMIFSGPKTVGWYLEEIIGVDHMFKKFRFMDVLESQLIKLNFI